MVFTLSACFEETIETEEEIIPTVKIITVRDVQETIFRQFPAEVEANKDSHLGFRVSGELNQFFVKSGDHVTKNQLLATLDPIDFQVRLDEGKARYILAKAQFSRFEKMLKKKLSSQSQFDEARANLLVSKANFKSTKLALDYTRLHAPYDGVVSIVFVENLQNIQAQQVILDMQNRDTIDVSIQVPERLIANVNKNYDYQPSIIFDFQPGVEHLLKVKEWDSQADHLTRTYKVVFTMPMPTDINILPGMTGTVIVDIKQVTKNTQNKHFIIPLGAVFSSEDEQVKLNNHYIWQVLPDMKVKRVRVDVGEITSQGVVIKGGLSGNEKIIGAGVHFIRKGMTVRAWQRERGL